MREIQPGMVRVEPISLACQAPITDPCQSIQRIITIMLAAKDVINILLIIESPFPILVKSTNLYWIGYPLP